MSDIPVPEGDWMLGICSIPQFREEIWKVESFECTAVILGSLGSIQRSKAPHSFNQGFYIPRGRAFLQLGEVGL